MATIIAKAARLKPEIRLAEAISQFEGSLSSHEKAFFRNERAQACLSSPSMTDVMRLTAQIDRGMPGKSSRCFGPRFTNFLSSVQQFAALGDVIVGGSQNIIACGVWSLVRMSILAVSKLSSYLEGISVIFMEIGRASPRHQTLSLIYRQSNSLQAHINEYFIIAVRFCHDVYRFAHKSAFHQFTTSIGGNIQVTQSELRDWAHEINEEVSFLVAEKIEEEAAQNSRFRSVSKKFSNSTAEHYKLMHKIRILDLCSKHDYAATWKQIRKSGNTSAFAWMDRYKNWKSAHDSRTLIYLGTLGCGKSVTLANMIDDIHLSVQKQDIPVVFFFTRQDLPESLKARTIIGSLVRQLLEIQSDRIFTIESTTSCLKREDMLTLLRSCYSKQHRVYLIIDGLDLCAPLEKRQVVDFLIFLKEEFWTLACVSLRLEPNYRTDLAYRDLSIQAQTVLLPDNSSDIASFVEAELVHCLRDQSLKLGDAALILKIQDALLKGSNGMFLWVALQIKALCTLETDHEIVEALVDLPADLSETYHRILQKSRGKTRMYQNRILQIITSAQRPLDVAEMREVLSVTTGQTDWTSTMLVNDVYSTLTACGCLVHVDEEDLTVRFVHPSVREYFLRTGPFDLAPADHAMELNMIEVCHRAIAEVIVTYLSYGVFDTQVSKTFIPRIDGANANTKIIESVTGSSRSVQSLAMKLLAQRSRPDFDLSKVIAQSMPSGKTPKSEEFLFVKYARQWCLDHVCAIGPLALGRHIAHLLPNVLELNAHGSGADPLPHSAFVKAVENDNESLLTLLLHSKCREFANSRFAVNNQTQLFSPLGLAICKGRERLVVILQESNTNVPPSIPELKRDPRSVSICHAVYVGNVDVVREMLASADLVPEWQDLAGHVCQSERGLIACAIWAERLEMVDLLMNELKVSPDLGGIHPVMEALATRNITMLKLLLESNKIFLRQSEKDRYLRQAEELLAFPAAVPILQQFPEGPRSPSIACKNENHLIHASTELGAKLPHFKASVASSSVPSNLPTSPPKSADSRSTSRLSSKPPPSPSPRT
ncbi:hypothetical protein HBI46_022850 [Parastagonospora nodorum]|nr:hypothetical protein HBI06_008040 [Parastagonospora nodorum]KAH5070624.1 hypothetical protein HBH96_007710 [Parastagonospora nodorum]KAH5428573.1 hypothetical protein HBI46_022850 [Parastagonospora nodorum]KAH5961982.1 hypothetical protein HBI85_144170 [Parastagonospora nodorum]